jgi:hypothetical protein
MRIAVRVISALVLILAGATAFAPGQKISAINHPSNHLKAFLRDHLGPDEDLPDTTTRITVVNVKTNDGKHEEYVVYISGQLWCGTGGCTLLILEPVGSSFKVLSDTLTVRLPIRLLASMKNGYPDIGVRVQGGGIEPGYEAVLSFDGDSYPDDLMPPARKAGAVRGKVIIATTEGSVPLYD